MWKDIKYQLDRVSRSFALCIPVLEHGLREIVGLAYILLRILDSIEDSLLDKKTKERLFTKFIHLLSEEGASKEDYRPFKEQEWQGISKHEVHLLTTDMMEKMIDYYWQLDKKYRLLIRCCVQEMAIGMQKFSSSNQDVFVELSQEKKALKTTSLYNEYCYYVAGTVGVLLTKICIRFYRSNLKFGKRLNFMSLAFGRLLQKVNIVKDCREDLEKGLCFLPKDFIEIKDKKDINNIKMPLILKDVKKDLALAKDYVFDLPDNFSNFKQFCLLALLPAYKTLDFIKVHKSKFLDQDFVYKIPRSEMFECLTLASDFTKSEESLLNLHKKIYQTT